MAAAVALTLVAGVALLIAVAALAGALVAAGAPLVAGEQAASAITTGSTAAMHTFENSFITVLCGICNNSSTLLDALLCARQVLNPVAYTGFATTITRCVLFVRGQQLIKVKRLSLFGAIHCAFCCCCSALANFSATIIVWLTAY